ncbi:MAG: hypothetical protein JWN48_5966 [Myxococcaceae bacterium]|nr:hypothetical protein [Myxococcaceae bacterium]
MTRNPARNKWSWLSLLSVLSFVSVSGSVGHASAEPEASHSEERVQAARIMQQRSGSMERREATRAPELKRLDDRAQSKSRVELERQQQKRGAQVDKRR